MSPHKAAVELIDVAKGYGGVPVVQGVTLPLYPGEAHALMGENGAGKSTLVKVLAGVHQPDSGQVLVNGSPVVLSDPRRARELGIAVIHQHPALFPDLDVVENIFVGHPILGPLGRVDWKAMRLRVAELIESLGVALPLDAVVRDLSMAQQQLVEIAKALSFDAKVLVMDEPTAPLSPKEVEELFVIARRLKERGVALMFISHRLEEVFALCDRVTVLRDGKFIESGPLADFTQDDIVRSMVGRQLDSLFPKMDVTPGEVVLEAKHLTRRGVFRDINFSLRKGEILALTGLVGAGRTEVARAIFGVDRLDSGQILLGGKAVTIGSPAEAVQQGIALVPEDRHGQGLVLDFDVLQNVSLSMLKRLSRFGMPRGKEIKRISEDYSTKLRLRSPGLTHPVSGLSGGNQQKVVISKWLATGPRVLILDEPTRGVDVGAKAEVHRLISELASQGLAILMISSEMPEVLGMADRVLVMHEGTITSEMSRGEATQEKMMYAAAGLNAEGGQAHD